MEIRDPVHGNIELSNSEVPVIDSAEYQRLRAIKQLGFAEFSFPAATHNRYLHSIGVLHVAGLSFDQIFKSFPFSKLATRQRLRSTLRLAALLHDVGHGPLSHTTEEVMPPLADLKIAAYKHRKTQVQQDRANHEDYTIKYLTDSPLTKILQDSFSDIPPMYVAALIDKTLQVEDDFFHDQGIDFRPILSQLVSSELDCDRMDYLERDSYFCGTNYGKIDLPWMINNMTAYLHQDKMFLALNRRALYTFDDFMISRHHMHLMVYFHHKSVIYEEMLNRYLMSKDCSFHLPADINEYTRYNDYKLHEHLANHTNPWAQRIAQRRPYRVLIELHSTEETKRPEKIEQALKAEGVDTIWASSSSRLSKYHSGTPEDRALNIYVVDQYDRLDKPTPIEQSTEIFYRYQGTRVIDRIYVSPEKYDQAQSIISAKKI